MSILNDKEITSVQDGTTNEFPTNVDAPPPPKSEQTKHTGAHNQIDPQIYHQNVKIRSLNWSVTDERGKVLAVIPVSPQNMGRFVEYLQPMYHYWSGGMMIELRVMGTAYQAGQVALIELPPDADAYEVATTGDYTGYNWVALDVKDPALVSIHCRDVNQGTFHYVSKQNNFGPLNIGSQFLLVVDSPLNSTTGGTQQVGIEIWAKPSSEFQFSRLRIPRVDVAPSVNAPAEIESALNFVVNADYQVQNNSFFRIKDFTILPNSVKQLDMCYTNHIATNGSPTLRTYWGPTTINNCIDFSEYDAQAQRYTATVTGNKYPFPDRASWYSNENVNACGTMQVKEDKGGDVAIFYFSVPHVDIYNLHVKHPFISMSHNQQPGKTVGWKKDAKTFTMPVDESFAVFEANKDTPSTQTRTLSQVLYQGIAKGWIPPESCATFMMIDAIEQVPIGLVKLWEEGFFSMRPSKDYLRFGLKTLKFVFKGFVPRTQQLKAQPDIAMNRMMVATAHRRSARLESGTQKER